MSTNENIKLGNIKLLNLKVEIDENKCDCCYCDKITSKDKCMFAINKQIYFVI